MLDRQFNPYRLAAAVALCLCTSFAWAEPQAQQAPTEQQVAEAVEKVKFPGITIDAKNKRVDVDATVTLDQGLLEVIACTNDSREHESIVVVKAAPTHIHAALLLLGAKNGHPAMAKPTNEAQTEFVHLPPRGDPISVSMVIKDEKGKETERPISDFIEQADRGFNELDTEPEQKKKEEADDPKEIFKAFVFAGSHVFEDDDGKRHYLADFNGNVISISTFGDEVLCLPWVQSKNNGDLVWQVNDKHLPKVGTAVKLRLTVLDIKKEKPGDNE